MNPEFAYGLSSSRTVIPLIRPDMTQADEKAIFQQLQRQPFDDPERVLAWEEAWGQLWQRKAVVFEDPMALIHTLKRVFSWLDGARMAAGVDLHPHWREGCHGAWLHVVHHDLDWRRTPSYPLDQGFVAAFSPHPFGQPIPPPQGPGLVMEDLSHLPRPPSPDFLDQMGTGGIQVMVLDGNGVLQGGGAAVVLSRDDSLVAALRATRTRRPSALVAALGLSQLTQLESFLARRRLLAQRYLAMRDRGLFIKPENPKGRERLWSGFHLLFSSQEGCESLKGFLNRAGIAAASPWVFASPGTHAMVWRQELEHRGLALPLYASLSDQDQKKIINRIHRWAQRGGGETSLGEGGR